MVGLLHDLDFEIYPQEHCIKQQEITREYGLNERLIRATASHGYALTVDIVPEHEMEKVLYAIDELTGLIGAVAIMRPSKSVVDLEIKPVKKKYKNTNFVAGCSQDVIEVGEYNYFTDEKICAIVSEIKACYPNCAITLSLDEWSYDSYKAYFDAGADRYLLRHETGNVERYKVLYPKQMSIENRKQCL